MKDYQGLSMGLLSWSFCFELYFNTIVIAEYSFSHGNSLTLCGDPNSKFLSFGNTSLSSCITECGRRPKCLALNHRPLYSNFCELFETSDTVPNVKRDCFYLRRDDIRFSGVLSNGCGCAVGESCDLETTTCSKSECFPLRTLANGKIIGNKYGIGNSLAVRCNQGFESVNGVTSVTCLSIGEWSQSPSCIEVCNPPATLENGIITGSDYTQGSTLDVICDTNYYELNGIQSITCLSSAIWSAVPRCTLKECNPPPSLSNGDITGSMYTVGSTMTVACNLGYKEESNITSIECLDSLQWDMTPNCVLRECDTPPSFEFGQLSSSVDYTVGTTLSINCDNGYEEANGLPHITCLQTATWDFVPECTIIVCNPPDTLENGVIIGSNYSQGSSLDVVCDANYYEVNSIQSITCLASAIWSAVPRCVLKECNPPLPLSNGDITGSMYTVGSTMTVACNLGYKEESNITSIECLDSLQWDMTPNCVLRECDTPPSFGFGHLSSSVDYTVGTTLSINCDNGYEEANGLPHITCLQTATWDFVPECTIIECSEPVLMNGVVFGNHFTVGSTLGVSCNTNYVELNGISTVTCMANGYWDNTPSCVASSFCSSNWIQVGSSCFYVSVSGDGNMDFSNSKAFCTGQGGNLARLDSIDKYEAVRNELIGQSNTVNNYWIGLRKYSNTGEMTWLDNNANYVYNNFASGEPGQNDEHCAFLWKNDGWQWHAGKCTWSNRFVCEKPAS